jgi:hypothetical protein
MKQAAPDFNSTPKPANNNFWRIRSVPWPLQAPAARHICRNHSQKIFSSVRSGIFRLLTDDAAPDGACAIRGDVNYRYAAPLALGTANYY